MNSDILLLYAKLNNYLFRKSSLQELIVVDHATVKQTEVYHVILKPSFFIFWKSA